MACLRMSELFFNCLCWLIISGLILPVSLIFFVFGLLKWAINFIVEKRHPDWVPLTALDLVCSVYVNSFDNQVCSNNIGFAIVIDSDVSVDKVRSCFVTLLLEELKSASFKFDRLRTIPVKRLGNYYWKPIPVDSTNLKYLIWERACASKTDFTEFLAHWLKLGFQKDGPLWEAVVYKDDDEYRGKTVFAFKMSHALGDGITIQEMAQAILISHENANHSTLFSSLKASKLSIKTITSAPLVLLKQVFPVFFHSDVISQAKKSAEMLITFTSIDKKTVDFLAHQFQCKFNDVLLSLWSNTLRRLLYDLKFITAEKHIPKVVAVVSPRVVPGRTSPMANNLTVTVLEVEMKNPSRADKLMSLTAHSKQLFDFGVPELMQNMMKLAYIIPPCFVVPVHNFKTGITSSVSSFPLINFQNEGQKVFGLYSASHFYMLQQLMSKNFGFTSTFITKSKEQIDVTIAGNRGIVQTQEHMNTFKLYLKEELKQMVSDSV